MEVSDPDSPQYGKYLSLKQVGDMTADPKAAGAVAKYLQSRGVGSLKLSTNGDFVSLVAPFKLVERIFSAKYQRFVHTKTSQVLHRSLSHRIPKELLPLVDFVAHVSEFPAPTGPTYAQTVSLNPNDAMVTPPVILKAYNVGDNVATSPANGMTVFEQGSYFSEEDLTTFEKKFGMLPQRVVSVGAPNYSKQCDESGGNKWTCSEASLDVQYILGVANNVTLQAWFAGVNDNTPFYDWIAAISSQAKPPLVMSCSYGPVEAQTPYQQVMRLETEWQKLGVRGISVFVSTGDNGAPGEGVNGNRSNCGYNPGYPQSSAYVTAVGATQFKDGNPSDGEVACQTNQVPYPALITTGGGFSQLFPRPGYQADAVEHYLTTARDLPPVAATNGSQLFPAPSFNAGGRGFPDVSALGHNYEVIIDGQVQIFDGTSASTPVTAGLFALLNDVQLKQGKPPLGFVNPLLYKLARTAPAVFNDITGGNNGCTENKICCAYGFNGEAGWDPVTGLGSINYEAFKAVLP